MKNKRLIIFLSTMIILIFSSLLFITYGYVTSEVSGNENSKQFASLSKYMKVEYSDGTNKLGGKSNDYFIPGSVLTKQFKITNTGNMDAKYSISLTNITNEFERREDLIYELYLNDNLIVSDILPNTNSVIAYNQECAIDEILNYTLKIIYKESDENQIVDQGKTISASLDFEKQETIINNIKLLGNTVQNGTPSLDSPAEILSVGDKTKNLFDKSSQPIIISGENMITLEESETGILATNLITGSGWRSGIYKICKVEDVKDKTVYFSSDIVIHNTPVINVVLGYMNETGENRVIKKNIQIRESGKYKFSLDIEYDLYKDMYIGVWLYSVSSDSEAVETLPSYVEYNNLMISTEENEYEPYGYKIPTTVNSKNLIEKKSTSRTINGVTFTNNPDGSITMNGTNTGTNSIRHTINNIDQNNYIRNIKLEAGTYTLSHRATLPKGIYVQANYVENGTSLYRTSPISFSINENVDAAVYIRFDAGVTADNITIYPQLEKGNEATEYTKYFETKTSNIYLTEPLSKIDTKYDVLDFKKNTVVRNIKNKLLTGGEDWKLGTPTFNETYLLGYYNNTPSALAAGNGNYSLSDRFVTRTSGTSSIDSQFLQIYNNNILIRALKTNFQNELSSDTVDARTAIKNWIGEHPTHVSYITAETFSLNSDKNILPSNLNLYTIPPYANISVGTSVQPTIEIS